MGALVISVLGSLFALAPPAAFSEEETASPRAQERARSCMIVNAPVADLRAEPEPPSLGGAHDPREETQLLYGESVRPVARRGEWVWVEALEQAEWTHAKRWQGYPGWISASSLRPPRAPRAAATLVVVQPWAQTWRDRDGRFAGEWRFALGTKLCGAPDGRQRWRIELLDGTSVWIARAAARELAGRPRASRRAQQQAVVRSANALVGEPYLWGGRSPSWPGHVSGLDCSGLVNLAYRSIGVDLPRDAHEQYLRATSVPRPEVADLIFLSAADEPRRIVHVMLYVGQDEVIEAPGTGQLVRRIGLAQRLGAPVARLASGAVVDGHTVWFGRYLN